MCADRPAKVPSTFPERAKLAVRNSQLRRNIGKATTTIRAKRGAVVAELPDWEELREAGRALKERTLRHLDEYLLELEGAVARAGGHVHWARDGREASEILARIAHGLGVEEVIKVKSITTEEIGLNHALAEHGVKAVETDLAELIVQLGDDLSSHILVPAIHRNRSEIRALFKRTLGVKELSDRPADLTAAARDYLRRKFLDTRMAVSGANFAVAETGTVCVVESEGNGRMCLTLPEVLVTVMGIEKVIPAWQDFEVFMQLLPRSSTGERMNPYTSFWTGVRSGDGPREFHLVLLDNGRSGVLADPLARQTLNCIRCSACLNVCPVYERTGGHAYASPYQGPIGAILTPQLQGMDAAGSLPYASSLCGACYEVCPVKINIPEILVHLRAQSVEHHASRRGFFARPDPEALVMRAAARAFSDPRRFERAQKFARLGQWPFVRGNTIVGLPGMMKGWTSARDLPALPGESFREWWRSRR
ncbi:MAG TPA: LutB/LldF family L-lactate oxidation iron-sulfur protein [Arenibaculum sp.]|nr:LutB/LldF family L-lactate oxidation iron-sulfur protein [Arenibaculum sp.]